MTDRRGLKRCVVGSKLVDRMREIEEPAFVPYMLTVALFAAAALPHVVYYVVWTNPPRFQAFVQRYFGHKTHPVDAFASAASLIKLVQLGALLQWVLVVLDYKQLHLPTLYMSLAAATMLVVGQVLNVAIYMAIGKPGVYYGVRLGKPVPWCHGFPFNVVSHPQYVGSVLTVLGILTMLWDVARESANRAIIPWLAVFWTLLYVVTAFFEDNL
ncbi:Phosphatidyl-N-methylethanolamine N-methyltransferase [Porphyridium purpureum]|uniref:phosphatidyl-N-methylethanolamine N-methyltransferase n=1 Tax=Porphyridium purpureum TaxID=35688 RepID=A0A5J4YM84_PORPP|nr:Phosphatidyl-N-methylethanolamine N-methyltransferase [Porphyridium purpureum]|eukprot:POR6418..scf244_11